MFYTKQVLQELPHSSLGMNFTLGGKAAGISHLPHSPTSIPHPPLTPGRRGPPQFPETGEWTQYPSSVSGADQVLPKLGRGGGA